METLINIDKDIIVLTTKTVEFLLSGNPDSLTLYVFYMKNARIQETNSIWNTNTFGMKGLGWGTKRYGEAKKFLVDNGFVSEVIRRDEKGQIEGRYLQINYIFAREKVNDIIHHYQNPDVGTATSGFGETNALSNKKGNALSNKKESVTELQPFLLEEEIVKLENSNWKPNKILALYLRYTSLKFENRKQFDAEIGKNKRGAIALEGYNSTQIIATMEYCEKNYSDMGWNLYTVVKRIPFIINSKIK